MTDTEIVEWIAEHLVSFRPLFENASMTYINNDGLLRDSWYESTESNPSNKQLLIGCIEKAVKNEV